MAEIHRIRTKEVRVKLTEEELKILHDKASYASFTAGQYIRRIIVDGKIIKLPVDEIKEASRAINDYKLEINHIGNNINQLVKIIHKNNDLYYEEQIREAVRLIETVGITFDELTKVMYERLYDLKREEVEA